MFFIRFFILLLLPLFFFPTDPSSSEIKAIVFDFGGVLAVTDRTEISEFFKRTLHLTDEEEKNVLKSLKIYFSEGGEERTFFHQLAQSHGVVLNDSWFEEFYELKKRIFREIPGMMDLVKRLQERGYQTPMLSNITAYQADLVRNQGYYDHFSPVLLSCEMGINKPDPRAYFILLDAIELNNDEILFIDDKSENVDAAKSLGIDSILFTDLENLLEELESRKINI